MRSAIPGPSEWNSPLLPVTDIEFASHKEPVPRGNVTSYVALVKLTTGGSPITFYPICDTSKSFGSLFTIDRERDILRFTVGNLWRIYRYNQHYIGYLAGGVSEEDFNATAEKYALEPVNFPPDQLRHAVGILLPIIRDDELTPQDLAVALNANPEQLQLALQC